MALRKLEFTSMPCGLEEYEFEVDSVVEAEWSKLMDQFNDANIYQTWAYGAVRWKERNLSHIVLKRRRKPLAMAQLGVFQPAGFRLGIAYLRWGPMWHPRGQKLNQEVISTIAEGLRQE